MNMSVLVAAVGVIFIHSCHDVTAKRNRRHSKSPPAGSWSPTAAPGTSAPEEVKSWLGRLGLGEFADAIEEQGYDDKAVIDRIGADEAEELAADLGMDALQTALLLKGIEDSVLSSSSGGADISWSRHRQTTTGTPPKSHSKHESEEALLQAGMRHHQENRLEEALTAFDEAIRAARSGGPTAAQAGAQRGLTLEKLGRLEEAVESYNTVLQFRPTDDPIILRRGLTLDKLQRLDEALESYNAVLKVRPSDPIIFQKGTILGKLDRLDESIASLRASVDALPPQLRGLPEPHATLCTTLYDRIETNLSMSRSAIAASGSHSAAITAYLEDTLDSCDKASKPYHGEVDTNMDSWRVFYLDIKGRVLFELRRYAEARHASREELNLTRSHKSLATELALAKANRHTLSLPSHGALHKLWAVGAERDDSLIYYPPWDTTDTAFPAFGHEHPPMWISQATGPVASYLNRDLVNTVREMMSGSDGVKISNEGGWQSFASSGNEAASFLEQGSIIPGAQGSAVRALRLHIIQQVSAFLKALAPPESITTIGDLVVGPEYQVFVSIRESWANVNVKGNWNSAHAHGKTTLAGCYYVSSGFPYGSNDSVQHTGLRFINPMVTRTTRTYPGGRGEWTSEALGRAGTLALWPGALHHWVPPHTGDLERISIAFNVELTLQ
jgi:tetratricopeptide (TPR) repeat protein